MRTFSTACCSHAGGSATQWVLCALAGGAISHSILTGEVTKPRLDKWD